MDKAYASELGESHKIVTLDKELPEQISWGTLICSKSSVKFQKALKKTIRLARDGQFYPAEEMAALWVSSPEALGFRDTDQALNNDVI